MDNRTYQYFKGKPLYSFGHGLSYTEFDVETKSTSLEGVEVLVRNTGKRDGKYLVKVFVREEGNTRLNCRLAGFKKVFVRHGEETVVNISLSKDVLDLFEDLSRISIYCE